MVAWVPLIYAGLQLAKTAGAMNSEKKQQKAYNEYQAKQRAAAWENYRYQTRALQNRYSEEAEATAYQSQENLIQNMQAKATAQASAAGSGITGSTIDNLFKDYDRASAASQYMAKRNLHLKRLQLTDQLDAARIEAMNVINNMQTYQSNSTSMLLAGIGNAFSAYAGASYQEAQANYFNRGEQKL